MPARPEEFMAMLLSVIKHHSSTLVQLNLLGNGLQSYIDFRLIEGLGQCKRLWHLNLAENGLNSDTKITLWAVGITLGELGGMFGAFGRRCGQDCVCDHSRWGQRLAPLKFLRLAHTKLSTQRAQWRCWILVHGAKCK
eukprot:932785-Rhodomonas_salina.1